MNTNEMKFAIDYMKENMPEWITEAELYCASSCYGSGRLVCIDPIGYVFKTSIEALEKVNKYTWHNLETNPNDLPEFFEKVMVCISCGDNEYDYEISHYGMRSPFNDNVCKLWSLDNVIAWKYIDKFN